MSRARNRQHLPSLLHPSLLHPSLLPLPYYPPPYYTAPYYTPPLLHPPPYPSLPPSLINLNQVLNERFLENKDKLDAKV